MCRPAPATRPPQALSPGSALSFPPPSPAPPRAPASGPRQAISAGSAFALRRRSPAGAARMRLAPMPVEAWAAWDRGGGCRQESNAATAHHDRFFLRREQRAIERDTRMVVAEPGDDGPQFFLDMLFAMAVEQVAEQATAQIAGAEKPIGD